MARSRKFGMVGKQIAVVSFIDSNIGFTNINQHHESPNFVVTD